MPRRGKNLSKRQRTSTTDHSPAAASFIDSDAKPQAASTTLKAGNAGTFLLGHVSILSEKELIGEIPTQLSNPAAFGKLQMISNFLSQYRAMAILARQKSTTGTPDAASSCSNSNIPAGAAGVYFVPTIEKFQQLQMDRQAAGLRSNTNRQTADGATELVDVHKQALRAALADAQSNESSTSTSRVMLTKERLCQWHGILCPPNYIRQWGQYRTTQARAGSTLFCPADRIEQEMQAYSEAMQQLYVRWMDSFASVSTDNADLCSVRSVYLGFALAAIVLYSICDIHPFGDGNGRLSRICANWMLARILGLPFSITITATSEQREAYVTALKYGHTAIANHGSGIRSDRGIFQPLIHHLLTRTAPAVQEVQRLLEQKSQAAITEEEERIVRRVRERTAAGSCIICLDDSPNIATLCCGQAVHLNCIAEWLADNASCVNCRRPFPQIAARSQSLNANNNNNNNNYNNNNNNNNNGVAALPAAAAAANIVMAETTTTNYEDGRTVQEPNPYQCQNCNNLAAQDCDNHLCGRCCVNNGWRLCSRHTPDDTSTTAAAAAAANTAMTETTTTDYDDGTAVQEPNPYQCQRCNNLAAQDCDNHLCGRCCVDNGWQHCSRHTPSDDTSTTQLNQDTASVGSTTIDNFAHQQNSDRCLNCNNWAAQGCRNASCGRCCVLYGEYNCIRHND